MKLIWNCLALALAVAAAEPAKQNTQNLESKVPYRSINAAEPAKKDSVPPAPPAISKDLQADFFRRRALQLAAEVDVNRAAQRMMAQEVEIERLRAKLAEACGLKHELSITDDGLACKVKADPPK